MDRASSEIVRAVSALNSRISTQMGLIQKLQRTSCYDEAIASLQAQIDDLRVLVEALAVQPEPEPDMELPEETPETPEE